jgi:SAM-dependent methyltransferase
MIASDTGSPSVSAADASTVAVFQQDWKLYRKMVDNNFLFHREAYGQLHRILNDNMARPFRFVDIACGDSSASAGALKGTRISHYHGIDFSAAALDIAGRTLKVLDCRVTLEQRDFLEAIVDWKQVVDVAWIGLSLHHLLTPGKLAFMRNVRKILAPGGMFLIYENTSPDGEDRINWLRRWDLQKPFWTAYSEEEWNAMAAHVHAADFPETDASWHRLGREAGFASVKEVFAAPTDLFRMYCFAT